MSNNSWLSFTITRFLYFFAGVLAVLNLALQSELLMQLLHDDNPAVSYYDKQQTLNASSDMAVSTDEVYGNYSLIVKESVEAIAALKDQTRPLPCVEQLRESTLNDQGLTEISKTLLLSSLDKLTYGRRNMWLSTLNPLIVTEPQLSSIRNICPAESIALVLLTNGVSNNVQEWLVHHLLMGIKKILIFEDFMPESIEQVSFHKAIEPFVNLGYVVRHEALGSPGNWNERQLSTYNFALQNYGAEYAWMGFIDADEFIVLHQEKCLASFLNNFTEFGGVVLQWRQFSPVGVPFHDTTKTSFEQYQYTVDDGARHIKSIVQPKYVKEMYQHHALYEEKWAVNLQNDRIDGLNNAEVDPSQVFSVAELRHFYMGDMLFALYEKVCGLNIERAMYLDIRIDMLKGIFQDGSLRRETSLPLIHNDLVAIMFNKSDELIVSST
jgi:hypothetical protein